jgi:hypothetical protein
MTQGQKTKRSHHKRSASWTSRVEQRTLARAPSDLSQAEQAFRSLTLEEQVLLMRELVDTRAAELCRAYANVIAVSYGFRRRLDLETGHHRIEREPCVKFLVKRKWRSGFDNLKRRLPRHLFAYWTIDGARRVCAIPTDIEDSRQHAVARPHIPQTVLVSVDSQPIVSGVITCAIERSSDPDQLYVISCKHVFSPNWLSNPGFHVAKVDIQDGGATVAKTVKMAGELTMASRYSLDSQLAKVEDRNALQVALGGLDVAGYARSETEAMAAADLWIVTPSGPINAKINRVLGEEHPINYRKRGPVEDIRHEKLFEVQTEHPTRGGHSGSPVLTSRDGGLLIGMLIAGPPDDVSVDKSETLSYVIPAWHIIDPMRYVGAEADVDWKLIPPH